jgi:site-specific DNA recombinase
MCIRRRDILSAHWTRLANLSNDNEKEIKKQLVDIDKKIEAMLERLMETSSNSLVRAYESKIENLEMEKLVLNEKLLKNNKPTNTFEETFRTAIKFWENPYKLWDTGSFESKLMVMRMVFSSKLPYLRGKGFRTTSECHIAEPIRLCGDVEKI